MGLWHTGPCSCRSRRCLHAIRAAGLAAAGLIAACLFGVPDAAAGGLSPTSCSGFVLGYSGPAREVTCASGTTPGGQSPVSRLEVAGPDFYLTVTYLEGKFREYIAHRPLRDIVDSNSGLEDVQNWRTEPPINGFDVALFDARIASNHKPLSCAVFARYAGTLTGPYEFPSGPGYRTAVMGYYCPVMGFPAGPAARQSLGDVLGRLKLP